MLERMPRLGLGTWQLGWPSCTRVVAHALELGYRHVDTARMYGNERQVGRGLRVAGVPREEVWVTTKIPPHELEPGRARVAVEDSLRRLGLDVLDLVLIHWPSLRVPVERTLEALLPLVASGSVRHLGVSNFTRPLLRRALAAAPILCNQVEFHPWLGQRVLLEACREAGVTLVAYSPLGRGLAFRDPVVARVAEARGTTPARVVLRWILDHEGVVAIPKATSPRHLQDNLGAEEVALADEDRAALDGLARGLRLVDPPFAPRWDPVGP